MRILLLSEGDAESMVGSFSGISKMILDHLRAAGDTVHTVNCDLTGPARIAAAVPVFSLNRRRWSSRYHLAGWPFRVRSSKAERRYQQLRGGVDVILQIGATFRPPGSGEVPYFLFCDSNIRVAERGRTTGHSFASPLTDHELSRVAARERQVYRGAAGIFPLSEYLRRSFIDDFGIDAGKVVAVGGGPNIEPATQSARTAAPGGAPTVLFVGAGFHRKGADLLLRAFAIVRSRIPTARLVMVGLRETITDPGVESLGFLRKDVPAEYERLRRAYESAHVFCLPTRFEPYGIVFLEAMSYGLPSVGPDAWAVPEMVLDGVTGYTVPPENHQELANALIRLLGDPNEAFRLGMNAREYAAENFTWPRATRLMRERMLAAVGLPAIPDKAARTHSPLR